jgi:hypothetical protein
MYRKWHLKQWKKLSCKQFLFEKQPSHKFLESIMSELASAVHDVEKADRERCYRRDDY